MKSQPAQMLPKVTIVTPSYNQGAFLEQAILSVLNQDYANIEYIIIDNASTDNSTQIIKQYAQHLSYWVSEPDTGQCDAINKGWRIGTGSILAWINCDDLYEPWAVREAVEYLLSHPEAGVVCGNVQVFQRTIRVLNVPLHEALIHHRSPGTTAAFMRRSVMDQVGYLNINYHYWIDPELQLRIGLVSKIGCVDRPWYRFRVHAESKSGSVSIRFAHESLKCVQELMNRSNLPVEVRENKALILTAARLHLGHAYRGWIGDFRNAGAEYRRAFRESPFQFIRLVTRWLHMRNVIEFYFGRFRLWRNLMTLARSFKHSL
jgi:glycosyltransferase involved in cell wall biosynthesis